VLAKILASIMMLMNVIFIAFLVNNLIITLTLLVLSGMSIFYLFYEKEEQESK
jgi:4-amino-4-deoxy-L-arabinose transferase-like glycosyltransferase